METQKMGSYCFVQRKQAPSVGHLLVIAVMDQQSLVPGQHWLIFGSISLATKPHIYQKKVIKCAWWTSTGIVRYKFLESGTTITTDIYSLHFKRF